LASAQAERHLRRIQQVFRFLPDVPDIFFEWESIVTTSGVTDTLVYDARLVAVMRVYGLNHVLTFNTTDFQTFIGIHVIDPAPV